MISTLPTEAPSAATASGAVVQRRAFVAGQPSIIAGLGHLTLPVLLASLLPGGAWQSRGCDLLDGNSTATIDASEKAAMYRWTVDGINQLYQQSFWFRVGDGGLQQAVYSLSGSSSQTSPNVATTESANSQLDFLINYRLAGGASGSGSARLVETVTIKNLTAQSLDLHFFQYTDFDLAGTALGDSLQLGKTGGLFTSATQTKGSVAASETLGTGASHAQTGLNNLVLNALTGTPSLILNDAPGPVGPGDAAYGFEWDLSLGGQGTFAMTLEKDLWDPQPVPEPKALALVLLALVGCLLRNQLRQAS